MDLLIHIGHIVVVIIIFLFTIIPLILLIKDWMFDKTLDIASRREKKRKEKLKIQAAKSKDIAFFCNEIEALKAENNELSRLLVLAKKPHNNSEDSKKSSGFDYEKYRLQEDIKLLKYRLETYKALEPIQSDLIPIVEKLHKLKSDPNNLLSGMLSSEELYDSILSGRLNRALAENYILGSDFHISCHIKSGDHIYNTSLTSCTCNDFQIHKKPCKHILYLHNTLGLLNLSSLGYGVVPQHVTDSINKIKAAEKELSQKALECKKQEEKAEESIAKLNDLKRCFLQEINQTYPHLALLYKKYRQETDDRTASLLSDRATTSRGIVMQLKNANKELKYRSALAEHQLIMYESMFPWLEEYKTLDIEQAVQYARCTVGDAEYDHVNKWLSPEEYKTLSITDKNQLALDRYKDRHKSDWEIGVEYERYIGYCYESLGFNVIYCGATERLEDMGRDLICERDGEILVVQCKRWSEHKTIHEKHIFQLFGTVMQLRFENPSLNYVPVFITTSKLSALAKMCADQLGIKISEHKQYHDYPCIKCNIGSTGEKIYHLPFDQQYDRVTIDRKKGERYVSTVREAEQCGFRRAKRHFATQ